MHYLIFVFTPKKPEEKEIENLMAPYEYQHWDWYTTEGGRWSHEFPGVQPVAILVNPPIPYAFVSEEHGWVASEKFLDYPPGMDYDEILKQGMGWVPNPDFIPLYKEALKMYEDGFFTPVDAHN